MEQRVRTRQATLRSVIALQGALIAHFPCQLGAAELFRAVFEPAAHGLRRTGFGQGLDKL